MVLVSSSNTVYPSPSIYSHTSQPDKHAQGLVLPPTLDQAKSKYTRNIMYAGSHPQTYAQPTQNAPAPVPNLPNFYQPTSEAGAEVLPYAISGPPPYPSPHAFSVPQTTQPIAPTPPGGRGVPVLRQIPGVMNQPGVMPPGGTVIHQGPLQEDEQQTHMIGSQERRGILSSTPYHASVSQVNSKGQVTQLKNADDKFPCPHCTKTYLRAKHLKRHLLRHAGNRPYRCVLCNDTFSRSDILKRHFQKCSIRRGNPAGVTHLSLPQAYVKKSGLPMQQMDSVRLEGGELHHVSHGISNLQGDSIYSMSHGYPMVPVPNGLPNIANDWGHMQQPSSVDRIENQGGRDRQPVIGSTPGRPGFEQQYGNKVSGSMSNFQMQSYNMPPYQNGIPMYQGGSDSNQQADWSQLFLPDVNPA